MHEALLSLSPKQQIWITGYIRHLEHSQNLEPKEAERQALTLALRTLYEKFHTHASPPSIS